MAAPTTSPSRRRNARRLGIGGYVSLAGEFSVLAELAIRRMDGTLTLGHAKQIDILALNRATGRTFKLVVKTSEKGVRGSRAFGASYAWIMDEEHGNAISDDLVYCFVSLKRGAPAKFFLVPSADVAAYIKWEYGHWKRHATRRTGKVSSMRMFRVPAAPVEPTAILAGRPLGAMGGQLGHPRARGGRRPTVVGEVRGAATTRPRTPGFLVLCPMCLKYRQLECLS